MYPSPRRPTSASSSRAWSASWLRAGTSSSGSCSTGAAAASFATRSSRARAVRAARRFRPDVVYAHFLFPTGLSGLLAATGRAGAARRHRPRAGRRQPDRVPLRPAARPAGREERGGGDRGLRVAARTARRVDPGGRREDGGRRLRRRPRAVPAARARARAESRVSLRRLADRAEERRPARERLRPPRRGNADVRRRRPAAAAARRGGRASRVTGYVPHDAVPGYLAAADVLCQPSLVEPFGQAALEALACGRSVVATRNGGPPEFVPPGAGVLVDPLDEDALAGRATRRCRAARPEPGRARGGRRHDLKRQAARVEAILERAVRDRRA